MHLFKRRKQIKLRNTFTTFIIEQTISGGFGEVFIVTSKNNPDKIAIKTIRQDLFLNNIYALNQFIKEAETWVNMSFHPNILPVISVDTIGSLRPCILLDYCPMSLANYIYFTDDQSFIDKIRILRQIVDGMSFLHNKEKLVHCDLKPSNILLSNDQTVRITDFGLSVALGKAGTLPYMAPEQHQTMTKSQKWDLFAFGIIIYELFMNRLPYPADLLNKMNYDTFFNFKSNDSLFSQLSYFLPQFPDILKKLMLSCTELNPQNRPGSFQEIAKLIENIT